MIGIAFALALMFAPQAQPPAAPLPTPTAKPVIPPKPPGPLNLQLVPVGGAIDDRIKLYFDERSVTTAPDGKKLVWRLFVFENPRMFNRVMAQAIWTLSDYDCDDASTADRHSVLLGMGLETQRAVAANTGSRLYSGAMSNVIIAEEVCNSVLAPGYRSESVSEAVRRARSRRD